MTLILSGTDGLSDVDGSAATPAIRGTDTNTGIFFPAADTVAIATGGAEALRVNSSQNVGIGTSSPATKLDVLGSTGILTRAAATQDGVALVGRAGGTSSYEVTLTSTTLTADRTLTLPDNSGTVLTTGAVVTVAQGGTGATSLTANNVLLGNGTSAVQVVAPGTNGNVLTSNGTTWTSAAAPVSATTISDDTTTNATRYLTFTSATSGTVSTLNVSSTKLTYNPSTGALSSTTVAGSSDERLKKNWRDLPQNLIEQLAKVKAGIYDRTDHDAPVTQVGVSAQSLQAVLPDAVISDNDGMLSVAYGNAALVAAIKLAEKVMILENRIAALEAAKG